VGITERKEREKQEMRQNIIDAAISMFAEEGYDKTSIRRIADKIEYSPATIYLYYKDKDELLYDVQKVVFDQLLAAFKKDVTAKKPFERLKQISYSYVDFGRRHPELYDLMFIIRAPMNVVEEKEHWKNGDDCFDFLLNCLDDCISQDLIRFDNKMLAAMSIWGMVHGLVSLDVRCRLKVMQLQPEHVEGVIHAAVEQYLHLIKK
jgi:AcrR family transcriptional regulator